VVLDALDQARAGRGAGQSSPSLRLSACDVFISTGDQPVERRNKIRVRRYANAGFAHPADGPQAGCQRPGAAPGRG
jgi:hypothetical protein